MPFKIVACTFSDNLSRNSCIIQTYSKTYTSRAQGDLYLYGYMNSYEEHWDALHEEGFQKLRHENIEMQLWPRHENPL